MADALRAARLAPDFLKAADLWLVEPSLPLRKLQAERLGQTLRESGSRWASSLAEASGGAPTIMLANEVLDCLPARQFVRTDSGWAERRVGLRDGALVFGLAPPPADFAPPPELSEAAPGAVVEISPAQVAFGAAIGARVTRDGGCALLIDYGRDRPEPGDTLQALQSHQKLDPLACPGEADLTVHADFPAVAAAARAAGAATTPIVTQGDFLHALGIGWRAEALKRLRPDSAVVIDRQLERLTAAEQMGTLFKALAIHSPELAVPGFESEPSLS